MTPRRFWARLRAEADYPLRRGAWYHVKKLGPRVPRPKNPSRFPGVSEYGVCPNCRERVPLRERLTVLRCTRCNGAFDVAWEEQYLMEN